MSESHSRDKQLLVLNLHKLSLRIGCSIITCIQSVLMVAASMFTNLKQKFFKCEVITANVGNQLKLCNTRSCIQFYFTNLGLHPKNMFCYPGQDHQRDTLVFCVLLLHAEKPPLPPGSCTTFLATRDKASNPFPCQNIPVNFPTVVLLQHWG